MIEALWLIPALPLAAFITIVMAGRLLPRGGQTLLGLAPAGAAAVLAGVVAWTFLHQPPPDLQYTQTLWTWIAVGHFTPTVAFRLDPLSIVFLLVVTGVGFLILLYSSRFMRDDDGYGRFFAYMNLFIASMLVLVLADNLLLLYLGWEGVGLCSYLLIAFWYRHPDNVRAARKAFLVTRIGDAALVVGILLIFTQLGTVDIQQIVHAGGEWHGFSSNGMATAAAVLILAGAIGKSAQLPLQTWLPDAMAGPTPTSALIHAATMVTAGVYLLARMHALFDYATAARTLVAIIGAATLLYGGLAALAQRDIKRVLAYSTISQVGYMFLGLGVGAAGGAVFHFVTHALFKSLLFLGAGMVILALGGEHNLLKMGGLRRRLPLVFWTFLIGASSLAAVPLVTAGFYSKDVIIAATWSGEPGASLFWTAAIVGVFLTGLYSFRMVFLAFFGREGIPPSLKLTAAVTIPLVVLAAASIVAGGLNLPPWWCHWTPLNDFLQPVLGPTPAAHAAELPEGAAAITRIVGSAATLTGILLAYLLYVRWPTWLATLMAKHRVADLLRRWWLAGGRFDWIYDVLLVRPFVWLARTTRNDLFEVLPWLTAGLAGAANRVLSLTQNGRVRWYAAALVVGALLTLAFMVLS